MNLVVERSFLPHAGALTNFLIFMYCELWLSLLHHFDLVLFSPLLFVYIAYLECLAVLHMHSLI